MLFTDAIAFPVVDPDTGQGRPIKMKFESATDLHKVTMTKLSSLLPANKVAVRQCFQSCLSVCLFVVHPLINKFEQFLPIGT